MFLLRAAGPDDLGAILELARYLDSPNLPADEGFLRARLERSERAFESPGPPDPDREYQFGLEDVDGRVVGTCAILSKHGTPEMPHYYLRVSDDVRRSASLDITRRHTTLQLRASCDGPSELGSLVLRPEVRGVRAGSPGKLLSWGRFAFIARHNGSFETHLLAEMRAAIDEHGRSAFWDAFGARFTGMSYTDADRLSATAKGFIIDLFPEIPFYASLLDPEVAEQLGRVHPETEPALKLLARAGMSPIGEIDPFDGGPFVGSVTAQTVPVRDTVRGHLVDEDPDPDAPDSILSTEEGGRFRAIVAPANVDGDAVRLHKTARDRLTLSEGEEVAWTPLPGRSPNKET